MAIVGDGTQTGMNIVIRKEPELDDSPGWAFNHSELFGPYKMSDGSIVAIEVHSNRGHEDTSKLMVNVTDKGDLIQLNIGKRLGEAAGQMTVKDIKDFYTNTKNVNKSIR